MNRALIMVAVVSCITLLIRFLPFGVFRGHTPQVVLYLGQVLPYAIMGMLVVYCLKSVQLFSYPYGIPEAVSCIVIVVLQWWKENTILSILAGTFLYMFLVQCLF